MLLTSVKTCHEAVVMFSPGIVHPSSSPKGSTSTLTPEAETVIPAPVPVVAVWPDVWQRGQNELCHVIM